MPDELDELRKELRKVMSEEERFELMRKCIAYLDVFRAVVIERNQDMRTLFKFCAHCGKPIPETPRALVMGTTVVGLFHEMCIELWKRKRIEFSQNLLGENHD